MSDRSCCPSVHFTGWDRLYPECEIVAICDILPEALKRRGGEYEIPCEDWYDDHLKMLGEADIDDASSPPVRVSSSSLLRILDGLYRSHEEGREVTV